MSQTSNPLIPSLIVSIDVASDKCTVAILKADKSVLLKPLDFDNGLTGFEWLETQINRFANSAAETLIGLEATARYWENLYHYFAPKGYQLVLLHPSQTHQWANRRGLRAKTDKLDALTMNFP